MAKKSTGFFLYDQRDYKQIITERVKDLRALKPGVTLKFLATKIPVQYTYLSKVLNSDSAHLSEDHLFQLGKLLELFPDEIDFLLLLRSYAVTESSSRKEELARKIESFAKSRKVSANYIDHSPGEFSKDLYYLLDGICVLVHCALFLESVQKNPRMLCTELGISVNKLKDTLRTLEGAGYLELHADDPFQVKEVKSKSLHFTRNHPLMRAHQNVLKNLLVSRLQTTSEDQKESFMVTFTSDEKAKDFVKAEFDHFIQKVQQYTTKTKDTKMYQLNFDFLKWL